MEKKGKLRYKRDVEGKGEGEGETTKGKCSSQRFYKNHEDFTK